jgi:hypothetical protein
MAETRVWVTVIISGVPVGTQLAWLVSTTRGCPFDVTLVVPEVHCAVTHGPFPDGGGGKVHPATVYGGAVNAVG